MLQQNILSQNKKQIFSSPTQHPDIILLHTCLQFCVIICWGRNQCIFWKIWSNTIVNGYWGKCSWSIYLQASLFAFCCCWKCTFSCWSSITFNFLKHNTCCTIDYVWSCGICEDFVQFIPFVVEDFITFSTDNLWRQVDVCPFQCICNSSFEFDTKEVRFTLT